MRFVLATWLAVALLVATAGAQPPYLFESNNEIGIFVTETPTAENAREVACYPGPPGPFAAYVIVANPYNDNLGAPISTVGRFEFRLEYPASLLVMSVLPPGVWNFALAPDFLCGGEIPVVGGGNERLAVLVTLQVVPDVFDPGVFFLAPLSDPSEQGIPGSIAIGPVGDPYDLSELHPISGSFDAPVFAIGDCGLVVPNEEVSWGGVKALFR